MYARSFLIHVAASMQLGENAGVVLGSTVILGISFLCNKRRFFSSNTIEAYTLYTIISYICLALLQVLQSSP